MLTTLYIRNYALIEEITVKLSGGLNVITGETGAGKSIILDALNLLLGDRASTGDVRQGSDKAVVEGMFATKENESIHRLLSEHGYDDDGEQLIIRREISSRGGSRAFLNDSPAPIHLLRQVGFFLIDLHGQHEHQTLLRTETHVGMVDNAGGLDGLVKNVRDAFEEVKTAGDELESLREREAELHRKREFYEFQLNEINTVDPKPGEETALEKELHVHENIEQVYELVSSLHTLLYESQDSVRDQLLRARTMLERLSSIDSTFSQLHEECTGASVIVEEIAKSLQNYSATIDFSPEMLEKNRIRLYELQGLRKKFGGTLESVIAYREEISSEINLAKNFDKAIEEQLTKLKDAQKRLGDVAKRLSQKRGEVAKRIEKSVVAILKELGIENGQFVVHISQIASKEEDRRSACVNGQWFASSSNGIDDVEFFISTNLGEEPKPLAKTASGGEISRIMLALKTILAKNDRLPILVFDEIDTGISGRIASKVGQAMRRLADYHQIIAITHLPQIAAVGSQHYVVEKSEHDGRTITTLRELDEDEHTREIAKLMSGESVTESSLTMARELMNL